MFQILLKPFVIITTNRELLKVMTVRLWFSRGKGGMLNLLWPLLTPIFLLLIYYFAFGVILKIRNISENSNYALEMFCGMAIFNIFAETINSSAYSITAQANLVKKAVFDLEVIPLASVGCAVISGIIYLCVALCVAICYNGFGVELFKIPLLFLLYIFFCCGGAYFISSLSVYLRDLPMMLPVITQALFFLTPIIYPQSIIPESLCWIIDCNPLSAFVCTTRNAMLSNSIVAWTEILKLFVWAMSSFLLGYFFFSKTKKGFADVL